MERKTIGGFISALRKANGMTQKDLAEKLNVSDKTVSRWERDDGAPDLALIPVIAEIFGVTCDELLRGERKPESKRTAEPDETSAKSEKQRKRILTMNLSKYRAHSFIAMGISVLGLIAAMICNLGFLRAYIGFFVGTVFYTGALLFQAIFVNSAFLSVSDESLTGVEINRFKASVVNIAKRTACVTLTLFGITLPLIIFPYDTYVGLAANSWLRYGSLFGILAFLVFGVIFYFLNAHLLKIGIYSMSEKEERVYWHNHKLKRLCAIASVVILAVTFLIQSSVNGAVSPWSLAEGKQFSDFDSFIAYMEQDIPDYYYQYGDGNSIVQAAPNYSNFYYDQFENEITVDEDLRTEVRIEDGTEEGKVVCEYIYRNKTVYSVQPSNSEDGLPITVFTHDDLRIAQQNLNIINIGFIVLYCLELLGTVLIYRARRVKPLKQ
ncbi:MAG: helix-turn-helix transcriptional regulator [Clostridia bacterium]|nr:helix-turn-helix transcriptional regulator [Clostridia bacterium]